MQEGLTLEKVSEAFSVWRQTRGKRSKIPDDLIQQIVQLKKYPPVEIMRALKLNSRTLKAILDKPKKIDFVSLPIMPDIQTISTIVCSLSRPDGILLKIALKNSQMSDFLRAFLCCK
jgi:hypothetical protein